MSNQPTNRREVNRNRDKLTIIANLEHNFAPLWAFVQKSDFASIWKSAFSFPGDSRAFLVGCVPSGPVDRNPSCG